MLKASYLSKDNFRGKYCFPTEATWWAQKPLRCQKFFFYPGKKFFIFTIPELKNGPSTSRSKSSETQTNSTLKWKKSRGKK